MVECQDIGFEACGGVRGWLYVRPPVSWLLKGFPGSAHIMSHLGAGPNSLHRRPLLERAVWPKLLSIAEFTVCPRTHLRVRLP